jgi:tryptophan halogenase
VDVGRHFNFDPGALDKAWIKNCCAIGLSGSFVEPLEASSIGTSIQQAFLLMHRLSNYNDKVIDSYNKSFSDIMENIRDFIVLHYITKKTNSKFWVDASNNELPDSLKHNLDIWQHKLPIREDFANLSNYILFTEDNFSLVMQGLDLFNHQSIKQEFDSSSQQVKDAAQQTINDYQQFLKTVKLVSHKDMLSLIRTL